MSLEAELAEAFVTSGLSVPQREEMIARGEEMAFEAGAVIFAEGAPADDLWILLEGEVELSRRLGAESVVMATMTTPGQWAGGFRAWAGEVDAIGYRATGVARSDTRCFRLPSLELAELMERWFPFGKHMITGIFQTVRGIDALVRQRGSLIALGTMAAGLAHEINNPAAAAQRAVEALRTTGDRMIAALASMAEVGITAEQYAALEGFRSGLVEQDSPPGSPLVIARREEELGEELSARQLADAWHLAPVLASAGVEPTGVGRVEEMLGTDALDGGLRWIASTYDARVLLDELADATERISSLVAAVRSFSQLDRASMQRVDLHEGIESTLVMLNHRLGDVVLQRRFAEDLPEIEVNAAELNQVWTNLLDNALDAMQGSGTLVVTTGIEDSMVQVEVTDTGHGIAPEVRDRVFEPFFTTKDVGKGTGLGLDISRRIVVEHHHGTIELRSTEEGTTATVRLPLT